MEQREISLKELFLVIWKGKYLIAIVAFAFLFVTAVGAFIYDKTNSEVATIVTFQWIGIGQGEYPDGSRFDYAEAIEPYAITLAIAETGLDLTTTDVRENLKLTPIVPDDVLETIQIALEEGEQVTYFATDYKVVLNNGELGITVEDGIELVNNIIEEFRNDFERKFINQVTVLDFVHEVDDNGNRVLTDFDEYEYIDAYNILADQISLITNAMYARDDSGFYSPTLGITFDDIIVQTDLLGRLEMTQIATRTNSYLLSKDKDYVVLNYEYKIEVAQLELDKTIQKEADAATMVDNYAGSVQTIIIPGLGDTQELEIDTYYNTLINNQITMQNSIAELEKDIEFYQLQIDRLNGDDPSFNVTPETQAEEAVKVSNYIDDAIFKLGDVVDDSNVLLAEYNVYVTSNVIKPLMAPEYQSTVSVLLFAAVGAVVGAGLGTVVVLFKHDWE